MAYSDAEIQTAVASLVQTSISYPLDTLGTRRPDITFNDIQQAAAGVFLLYPNSPFYVVALGASRVVDLVATEEGLVQQLLAAIEATGRRVLPVNDVSPLFNAQAALQSLATAAAQGSTSLTDVTSLPAYQQFSSSASSFLSGPAQNVVSNGDIVQTPQEAQAAIPGLLTQLTQAHQSTVAAATSLAAAIDDYNSLDLPAVVASSVISNAATLLGSTASSMQSLTPTQRNTQVRQATLNVLASQAVVSTFGTFSGPSDFYPLTGTGFAYSDAQHEATPAVAISTVGGAVPIIQGVSDTFTIAPDGGAPITITLSPSTIAVLDSTQDESNFLIGNGSAPAQPPGYTIPNNNVVKINVSGTIYTATLTLTGPPLQAFVQGTGDLTNSTLYGHGGGLDGTTLQLVVNSAVTYSVTLVAPANAAAVASQINAVTNVSSPQVVANVSGNFLTLNSLLGGGGATISLGSGSANVPLGFTNNQTVSGSSNFTSAAQICQDINNVLPFGAFAEPIYSPLKYSGALVVPAGTNPTLTIPVSGSTDLTQLNVQPGDTVTFESGPNNNLIFPISAVSATSITIVGTVSADASASVQIGPKYRRIRITANNLSTTIANEEKITLFGDTTPSTNSLVTLGYTNGIFAQCKLSTLDLVANSISGQTAAFSASTTFVSEDALTNIPARTDLSNPSQITLARLSVVGNSTFSGTSLSFTVTGVSLAGAVLAGDVLVLRSGATPAYYAVQDVNGEAPTGATLNVGDVVLATGAVAGTSSTSVVAEIGPPVAGTKYDTISVASGPNNGEYYVLSLGSSPIDVIVQAVLPLPFTGQLTTAMTVSYGRVFLELTSKNKTTASGFVITGSPLYQASPFTQLGSSPWFQLPSIPRGLQTGDLLEYFATQYNVPDFQLQITSVDPTLNIIGVSPDFPDGLNVNFATNIVPPFGRLHVGKTAAFTSFQIAVNAWLLNPVNQTSFFTNLNRLINPLLVNAAATPVQVGAATAALNSFYAVLSLDGASANGAQSALALQSIMSTYYSDTENVPQIDALLQSYKEKGSDLAIDTLLLGEFSTFFGLTAETSSYAGAFQAATRAVAMNDLPVNKYNRSEAVSGQVVAQVQSPDLEFTASSVNETIPGPQVQPPTDYGQPSNYGTITGSSGAGSNGA